MDWKQMNPNQATVSGQITTAVNACRYCGTGVHTPERCMRVAAIRYRRDGSIKRVALHPANAYWPPMVMPGTPYVGDWPPNTWYSTYTRTDGTTRTDRGSFTVSGDVANPDPSNS